MNLYLVTDQQNPLSFNPFLYLSILHNFLNKNKKWRHLPSLFPAIFAGERIGKLSDKRFQL